MLTNDEIITELEYLIERGVPKNVEVVFLTLCGVLKTNSALLHQYALLNQQIAREIRDLLISHGN